MNYMFTLIHRVIDGFDTLDDLEKLPVDEKSFRPKTEIKIRRVTIHANPLADWKWWTMTITIANDIVYW